MRWSLSCLQIRPVVGNNRGIALLLVLWIMMILMVLVLSFSFLVGTESKSTVVFRETIQKKAFAEGGIQRAILEIQFRAINVNQTTILEGMETFRVDGTQYTGSIGKGRYEIRIFEEAGKININRMDDFSGIILRNLLVNNGSTKEEAEIISDSILDWIDKDDLHRLNGAEDEFYLALPMPYKAKNGTFDVMEELLLVRGMTPEILYGTKERKGLNQFITIYGNTTKINANAASREVLMAIPGMSEDAVARVLERRAVNEIRGLDEFTQIIGQVSLGNVGQFVDLATSGIYTIESKGFRQNEAGRGYAIRTTAVFQGTTTPQFVYYKSPAE